MALWRVTRRVGAWPHWLLVEDVVADDLAVENDGKQLVLYIDTTVVDTARRIVVLRMDASDIVDVTELSQRRCRQKSAS